MQAVGAAVLALAFALPALAQAPAINVPGQGQRAQPMPAPAGPQLQPGQFLPTTPPAPGTVPPLPGPAIPSPAPLAPVQSDWIAQRMVELRATDKVMARTTTLTAQLGETIRFGPLSVVVRECVIRPPDRPQDAAAFLEINQIARGEGGRGPVFRGWMLLSLPQLALVEHPTHDIRLAACKP